MVIKSAIFDMDGTILDSMKMWRNLGENYLIKQGINPPKNINEVIYTMTVIETASYFIEEYGLAKTPKEISGEVKDMVMDFYKSEVERKPGALDFMKTLHAEGIPITVATASTREMAQNGLKGTGLLPMVDKIFTCEEIGQGKEFPDVFVAAWEHLGTDKKNTVVFEDAYYAVKTAKDYGFPVIAMYDKDEEHNKEKIIKTADFYSDNFGDIKNFLNL